MPEDKKRKMEKLKNYNSESSKSSEVPELNTRDKEAILKNENIKRGKKWKHGKMKELKT